MVQIIQQKGWRYCWIIAGLFAVLSAGCAKEPIRASKPSQLSSTLLKAEAPVRTSPKPRALQPESRTTVSIDRQLRSEVRQWQGTPHKMGGTGKKGVDCSGFVQRLYRDILDRHIPRSTALQVRSGRPIQKSQLAPGDLVFFKPPHKVRHVGIYLGQSEFAHASSKRGVTISHLDSDYWRKSFWTARRYL